MNQSSFDLTSPPRFTADALQFSNVQLARLFGYIPNVSDAVVLADPVLVSFLDKYGLRGGFRYSETLLLQRQVTVRPKEKERTVRPDEYTKDTADQVVFSKDHIEYRSQPPVKIANSVVPTEKPQRPGTAPLAVFLGMMVDVSGGQWVLRGNQADFAKVYKQGINVANTQALARQVVMALNADRAFADIPLLKRSAVKKDMLAKFFTEYLNRLSNYDYLLLHCQVVYTCLSDYVRASKGYIFQDKARLKGKLEPAYYSKPLALEIYSRLTVDEKRLILQSTNEAPPRILCGRAEFQVYIPKISSILELNKLIGLRTSIASDSTLPFLLYSMKGYSAMVTKMGKRVTLLCALALHELCAGYPVDIFLTTSGDVSLLANSLDHCISRLKLFKLAPGETYFRFILGQEHYANVKEHQAYVGRTLRSSVRCLVKVQEADGVVEKEDERVPTSIYWSKQNLPTSAVKGTAIQWEVESERYLCVQDFSRRWIYVGAIFGTYMFGEKIETQTSTVDLPIPKHKAKAFHFGDGSNMRGILSNHEVGLVGFDVVADDRDILTYKKVVTELKFSASSAEWYDNVRNENGYKLSSWFGPINRYSSISNNLYQTRRGAQASVMSSLLEAGELTQDQINQLFNATVLDQSEAEIFEETALAPSTTDDAFRPSNSTVSSPVASAAPDEPIGEVFSDDAS